MENKQFFNAGDIVIVKHLELENKPKMLIIDKSISEDGRLNGLVCQWFDKNQSLQIGIFSTKDLILSN